MYGYETSRLQFVEQRDGKAAALAFAKQGVKQYRASVLQSRKRGFAQPHHASLPEFRAGYIESYLSFKKYIRLNS